MIDKSYGESGYSLVDRITIKARLKHAHCTIVEYIRRTKNQEFHLIELGCGFRGENLLSLSKEYPKASFTGVDVKVTDEYPKHIQLIEMDLNRESIGKKFDIILSLAVIEHLENPLNHFQHIQELAHKDTLVGLTTPTPQSNLPWTILRDLNLIDSGQIHVSYLTEEGIKHLSEKCGLVVCEYRKFELGLNQSIMLQLK